MFMFNRPVYFDRVAFHKFFSTFVLFRKTMSAQVASARQKELYETLRALQEQKGRLSQKTVQLSSQIHENDLVLKQLNLLESDDTVYKLIGPVLVSQEPDDGKRVVQGRLDFLQNEHTKVEAKIKELTEKEERALKSLEDARKGQHLAS